ncbi:hypothetical protein EVAR_45670_1 [Eumeta japonica]|uniref:Uncharacterized protein n=1 Tax=Eumeta variegata TaxID=151549 RepID=A0A4C1XK70_EUMVA|nr:hypothetical protein EVAR_45670_1 [Eumeta japonica]
MRPRPLLSDPWLRNTAAEPAVCLFLRACCYRSLPSNPKFITPPLAASPISGAPITAVRCHRTRDTKRLTRSRRLSLARAPLLPPLSTTPKPVIPLPSVQHTSVILLVIASAVPPSL